MSKKIQELASGRHQSGTVASSERHGRFGILPRRLDGRGGASVMRRDAAVNRTKRRIPMSTSASKKLALSSAAPALAAKPAQKPAGNAKTNSANPDSKQSRVVAMLRAPAGATIAGMMKATGWQKHSVRGFLAGVVRKRLKLKLTSEKVDGNRVYQIAGVGKAKSERRRSKTRSR